MESIFRFYVDELEDIIKNKYDTKGFVAKQIWSWFYCKGSKNFDDMTNISKELRSSLNESFTCNRPKVVKDLLSIDGTQKWLLELKDKETIELVYIPSEDRGTLCISSQVGCPMGCRFCNTGAQGLVRNLSVDEIVQQVVVAKDFFNEWDRKDFLSAIPLPAQHNIAENGE